eukprot:4259900-Alexandrium_andersonii.AAC.1
MLPQHVPPPQQLHRNLHPPGHCQAHSPSHDPAAHRFSQCCNPVKAAVVEPQHPEPHGPERHEAVQEMPVSYTHLTLPTICSV